VTARRPAAAWTRRHELNVTPTDLLLAPELAVLALLDQALRIAAEALLAAQPALLGEPPPWRVTPDLLAARRFLQCATRLARATAHYRRCVLPPTDTDRCDDDDRDF